MASKQGVRFVFTDGSRIIYRLSVGIINQPIYISSIPLGDPFTTVVEVTIGSHIYREPVLQVQLLEFISNSLSQMSLNMKWMPKQH